MTQRDYYEILGINKDASADLAMPELVVIVVELKAAIHSKDFLAMVAKAKICILILEIWD